MGTISYNNTSSKEEELDLFGKPCPIGGYLNKHYLATPGKSERGQLRERLCSTIMAEVALLQLNKKDLEK